MSEAAALELLDSDGEENEEEVAPLEPPSPFEGHRLSRTRLIV